MNQSIKRALYGSVISIVALNAQQAMACASCGCTLTTDWGTQGVSNYTGWSADIRYDYINQNMLRSGANGISQSQAAATTNTKTGSPAEVENYTRNNYITAAIDYNQGESWGVTATVPYINRSHSTLGAYDDDPMTLPPASGNGAYNSNSSGFGDIRLVGRYFGFAEQKDWGIQLGIKMPTGQYNQGVTLTNQTGSPTQFGGRIDPGLQLGTGTWDSIIGAYKYGYLNGSDDWGYFAQALFQSTFAINRNSAQGGSFDAGTYRPGNSLNLNAGVRYQGLGAIIPALQINYLYKQADSGTAADTWATGGNVAYVTPGVIVPIDKKVQVYGNVQLPIYQYYNGIQVAPSWIGSAGVRITF